MPIERLPRFFFARDTHTVAKKLLGKLLVRNVRGRTLTGRITEVESYVGEDDLACHASRGRTPRIEVIYGEAGHAYVYLIYGMYYCLNVVTEKKKFPAAILIRAIEPIEGIEVMIKNRKAKEANAATQPSHKATAGKTSYKLTNGPGKLCQALAIDKRLNSYDMVQGDKLYIGDDGLTVPKQKIATSPRIGVDYAGVCAAYPWRYYIKDSLFVSKFKPPR